MFRTAVVLAVVWFFLIYLPNPTPPTGDIPTITEMTGAEVVVYYFYLFQNYFADYSWQVCTSYFIVVASMCVMVILFFKFARHIYVRKRDDKEFVEVKNRYLDPFRMILGNDTLTDVEMIDYLGADEATLRKVKPDHFMKLLAKVRMELYEVVYLPNFQPLADLIGVREHMELNLLKGKDVFQTLQVLLLFQLIISEGRLATHVNSSDKEVRMLARLCYILCSENEPYRYLRDDLNKAQAMLRPMLLHYIFGWMREKQRRMPSFILLAKQLENEEMQAFLIKEIAYWGGIDEKRAVRELLLSPSIICRSAAISVISNIKDKEAEPKMIETYEFQPENIRRDILNAILSIKSGTALNFLVHAFENSSSRPTRELALSCIYNYDYEGRRKFEELRTKAVGDDRTLIDQIDTQNVLTMLRSYI